MRLTALSVLASGLLCTAAHAQYQFGIAAGPQYVFTRSVLNIDLPDGVKLDLPTLDGYGYHGGVWYRSDRLHLVNFRAGLNWAYRTLKTELKTLEVSPDTNTYFFTGSQRTRLNYLEMPLQGQYYFWRGAHAELGVVFSRLMSGKILTEGQYRVTAPDGTVNYPDPTNTESDDTGDYANFELAFTVGAGYDFRNGICAGLSYIRGLTPIEDGAGVDVRSWFNALRLSVGYDFLHPKGHRVYRYNRGRSEGRR